MLYFNSCKAMCIEIIFDSINLLSVFEYMFLQTSCSCYKIIWTFPVTRIKCMAVIQDKLANIVNQYLFLNQRNINYQLLT